jgi:PTS system mannose-specific IIC component
MMDGELIMLVALGALLGLDTVSFPQAMISRPLIAATVAGALLGDPAHGLLIGATLELFAVDTLPFGASRYPEWGSSSVVGGGLFVSAPDVAGALTTAVLASLAMAWTGGLSMLYLRRFNAWLARRRHGAVVQGDRNAIVGLQLSGLTADLVRGAMLTAAGLLLMAPLRDAALARWSTSSGVSRAIVVATAAAVTLGATYKLFHGVPRFVWYFGGALAAGLLLVLFA